MIDLPAWMMSSSHGESRLRDVQVDHLRRTPQVQQAVPGARSSSDRFHLRTRARSIVGGVEDGVGIGIPRPEVLREFQHAVGQRDRLVRTLAHDFVGTGKRCEAVPSGATDDAHDAAQVLRLCEVAPPAGDGSGEAAVGCFAVVDRLDRGQRCPIRRVHQRVLLCQGGPDDLGVVVAKEAGEGVALHEPNQRMQSGGLQAGRVGDGQVDTGAERSSRTCAVVRTLAGALERRGRLDVADTTRPQRLVHGRGDLRGPLGAALVAVDSGTVGVAPQDLEAPSSTDRTAGGVGWTKAARASVVDRCVVPFVVGENADRRGEFCLVRPTGG
ncbi:hypothetical protein GS575_27960 [Rhodococcus hoagii]|nr:hypothetical protein [Prescottella equi]